MQNSSSNKQSDLSKPDQTIEQIMEPPAWLKSLRDSMASSIQGDDLKEIMKTQVEKAKQGDMGAARFIFDQANKMIAAGTPKSVTITQNVFQERPDTPATDEPHSNSKVGKMRARAAAGLPLTNGHDAPEAAHRRFDDDEAEKAFRRNEDHLED